MLVGLIIFTKKMIDKYQKEGAVSEVEVTDPLAASSETSADVAPSAEAAAALTHTSPSPAATVMSTPLSTPTPSFTPSPAATPTPTTTPSPSPSPSPANQPVEVIIEALDNVEIEYTTKNGKSEKIVLTAEQVHTFKSKTGLRLNINNGGAINVIVNGKDLGIPGNLGKPVKLNF